MAKANLFWLLAAVLLARAPADAQQQAKVAKIGWLGARSASAPARDVFIRELRALGYIEGKNITTQYRYAEGKLDRLPSLADELVRLKVDVLVAPSQSAAFAAKNATNVIPIVFYGADPVGTGLVDSLAHPGGNVTGFSVLAAELGGKRLELLKETIPKLSRVAALWNPRDTSSVQTWKQIQLPARELGLQLFSMEVTGANKFQGAFKDALKARSGGLAVLVSPFFNSNQGQIVDLAAKYRLPAIYYQAEFVVNGGLMSYGSDEIEPYRRIASMVDKILKGTKPADIPIEQPMQFELAINLKTAKALGLTIPPIVLMRATRVIK